MKLICQAWKSTDGDGHRAELHSAHAHLQRRTGTWTPTTNMDKMAKILDPQRGVFRAIRWRTYGAGQGSYLQWWWLGLLFSPGSGLRRCGGKALLHFWQTLICSSAEENRAVPNETQDVLSWWKPACSTLKIQCQQNWPQYQAGVWRDTLLLSGVHGILPKIAHTDKLQRISKLIYSIIWCLLCSVWLGPEVALSLPTGTDSCYMPLMVIKEGFFLFIVQ